MSERITCDGCRRPSPADYNRLMAHWSGWLSTKDLDRTARDFCSFTCLATYALSQPGVKLPAKRRATPKPATVDQLADRRKRRGA